MEPFCLEPSVQDERQAWKWGSDVRSWHQIIWSMKFSNTELQLCRNVHTRIPLSKAALEEATSPPSPAENQTCPKRHWPVNVPERFQDNAQDTKELPANRRHWQVAGESGGAVSPEGHSKSLIRHCPGFVLFLIVIPKTLHFKCISERDSNMDQTLFFLL